MAVLFFVKTPMKYFLPTVLVGVGVVALLIYLQPYRMARLVAFTDPWAHQYGGGYQLTQALIAIGRGEWLGLGLGNSVQKLFYLPEAHTDFLFSILVEELGIAGALLTLAGVWRPRGSWAYRREARAQTRFCFSWRTCSRYQRDARRSGAH